MAETSIFVSYRRADTSHVAGRLCDRLGYTFGKEHVFYDVDSIKVGTDFREVINSSLEGVGVVLVLIGPQWDAARLHADGDAVRAEIREALSTHALVVPVLVDEAIMPTADQLPPDIAALAYLNAARLRPDPDFDSDSERILRTIAERRPGDTTARQDDSAQWAAEFGRSVAGRALRQVNARPVEFARALQLLGAAILLIGVVQLELLKPWGRWLYLALVLVIIAALVASYRRRLTDVLQPVVVILAAVVPFLITRHSIYDYGFGDYPARFKIGVLLLMGGVAVEWWVRLRRRFPRGKRA